MGWARGFVEPVAVGEVAVIHQLEADGIGDVQAHSLPQRRLGKAGRWSGAGATVAAAGGVGSAGKAIVVRLKKSSGGGRLRGAGRCCGSRRGRTPTAGAGET